MSPLTDYLFAAIALLTGLSAVMVVVTQNVVRAAVWLLFALAGASGVFFLLGSDLIGAVQLIVYVGGTLVLVIFGVMLTAQGPFVNLKTRSGEWAIALIVGAALYGTLMVAAARTTWNMDRPVDENVTESTNTAQLGMALMGVKEATPHANLAGVPKSQRNDAAPARERMGYLLPFEIVSVHLLVVLIGAAYLARAKRRQHGAAA